MLKAGERLKEERLKQGLTLEEVSQNTKIRKTFLDAIEKSEYEKLPASTFAQGFVRNYTQFLKLPDNEVIPLFRREFDEERVFKVLPEGVSKTDFPVSRLKKSQLILIPFLFLILIAYLIFQYKDAIINPNVDVTSPKENMIVLTNYVLVTGTTNPDNLVFINNFPVSVNDDGTFKKSVSVFPGKALVTIKIINRFNKTTEVIKHITVATQ